MAVAVFEQLDRDHRAQGTDFTDHRVLGLDGLQAGYQTLANSLATIQQVLFFEHFHHGQGRGASDRATGVGAAQAAWSDGVHVLGLAAHTGQREAASDGFGEGGQVGSNAHLFHGEESTGTASASLYFVSDQQDAVLVAQGTQTLHEFFRSDVETTFALNRLDDDRGDVFRLGVVLEDAFDGSDRVVDAHTVQFVRVQRAEDAAWHQAHAGRVRHDFTGQAQGHHGTAVVSAGERDHASTAGSGTSDLDCVLDRFGTGGDQQGFLGEIAWDLGVDLFAHFYVRLVRQHLEAGVGQLVQLRFNGSDHFRVHVTGVQYGDTTSEVDELAAFNVDHGGVLGRLGEDRVDLANTAWDSGYAALHQGFVSLAHGFPHSPLIGRRGSRITRPVPTAAAYDDRLLQRPYRKGVMHVKRPTERSCAPLAKHLRDGITR
ncbi:hypothetical protein D3C84_563060 [compost metagenome]